MTMREFVLRIANLLIESDEATADWVKITALRRYFYVLFSITLLLLLLFVLGQTVQMGNLLKGSIVGSKVYRLSMFLISLGGVVSTIILACYYFKFILSRAVGIRLSNIITFYIAYNIFFGFAYFYLYLLSPDSFSLKVPSIEVSPTMMVLPGGIMRHFLLFSAFQSVNGNYYGIQANSALVSIMTYFQSLFTIALISLLIASYVNQKTNQART